jgi:putative two-component system response regulator
VRIMAVDDERISLAVLQAVLSKSGHEVVTARDGIEALEVLPGSGCRMVITDWEMPRMDGPELCRRLRAMGMPSYVYVIVLSARSGSHSAIEALSAGADEFLTKPVDAAELTVRVRTGARILGLETRDLAIFALAKLAESRDNETGAHLERVREYSRALAVALRADESYAGQIDDEFVRHIYLTSPLHDIGKVGIPDSVLLKPARLSDEEFAIMKRHAELGAETLDAVVRQNPDAPFLRMARDIALTHHEQWDGRGYPRGLRGEEIPLAGRVVAAADVYDALTSKRVYKAAFPHQTARQIILDGSGKHFDPGIVKAFERCEAEFVRIRAMLCDAGPEEAVVAAPGVRRAAA